jgi:hypothetical protein
MGDVIRFPVERRHARIAAEQVDHPSMTTGGGWCAPSEPMYDMPGGGPTRIGYDPFGGRYVEAPPKLPDG